jgi:hypothetical protein
VKGNMEEQIEEKDLKKGTRRKDHEGRIMKKML